MALGTQQVTPQTGGGDPQTTILPRENAPPQEDLVGAPVDPSAPPPEDKVGQPIPERGIIAKTWTHFLGTDVQDPQAMTRLGSIIAGSLAGGVAGGAGAGAVSGGILAVPGAVVGSIGGGLAGAIYPEAAMELGMKLGAIPPDYRAKHGLTNDELTQYLEGEALLDIATGGGVAGARLVGRGIGRMAAGVTKAGTQTAETAARYGIDLLPVQVGEGRVARMYVNVLGKFGFMSPGVTKGVNNSIERYKVALDMLPERLAPVAAASDTSMRILSESQHIVKAADKQWAQAEQDILARATSSGMQVDPILTVTKAEDIIKRITATQGNAPGQTAKITVDKGMADISRFIKDTVLPMQGAPNAKGNIAIAAQNFATMNQAIDNVEKRINTLVKTATAKNGNNKTAIDTLTELKTQMVQDLHQNARGKMGSGAQGKKEAGDLIAEWDANSKLMTDTLASISDTVTTNKLRGLDPRGYSWASMNGTGPGTAKVPLDSIIDVLIKDESPEIMDELARITKPDTYAQFASKVLERRLVGSYDITAKGGKSINPEKFAEGLGLNNPKGSRYAQTKAMLDNVPGGLTMDDMKEIAKIGEAIKSVEAPNVSSFLARRVALGGSILGIGGISAIAHGLGPTAGLGLILGGRTFSKLITNPASSRLLKSTGRADMSLYMKRQVTLRAIQVGLQAGEAEAPEVLQGALNYANAWFDDIQNDPGFMKSGAKK